MRLRGILLQGLIVICTIEHVTAQCNAFDFTLPATACLQENIFLSQVTSGGSYSWDFCVGDFNNQPSASTQFLVDVASGRPGFELVEDAGVWYGFLTGTYTNTLTRVTFGGGVGSSPSLTENLSAVGSALQSPGEIRILNEAGVWYGLIHNTATGDLVKLNFGNSLANSPTVSILPVGVSYFNGGFGLGRDNTDGWVCVFSNASNKFSIVRLGFSLTAPQPGDILVSDYVPAAALGDVDVVFDCGSWHAFASDLGGGSVFRADFGTNLFSTPTTVQIANLPVANSGRIRIAKDGGNYIALIPTLDGFFFKLFIGSNPTNVPVVTNEGNIGGVLPGNIYTIAVAKEISTWTVYTSSQGSGSVFKISYPNSCGAIPQTSSKQNPSVIYSSAGTYQVSLSYTSSGMTSAIDKAITVQSLTSPSITFNTQNKCTNSAVGFTSFSSSGNITNYNWDFGDGSNSSSTGTASHIYSSASTFYPSLTVTASSGCQNFTQDTLQIFNPPQANFNLPSVSPICTNQNYSFTNASTYDVGSAPTWQWSVNGNNVATTQDLNYLFSSSSSQSVTLTAFLPGCSTQVTQSLTNLVDGPLVQFNSPSSVCVGAGISFTNSTIGATNSTLWTYGDGNSTSQTDGANIYSTNGLYTVTLRSSNAAGCQNSYSKKIAVYTVPQPNFAIEAAPSSCTNWPSQFDNKTPPLIDSNISSWLWDFGDGVSPTSSLPNPANVYTQPATYKVTLRATSNFGCTNSITLPVTISLSPQANFTNSSACVGQPTTFSDASQGSISKYQWSFQGSTVPAFGVPTLYVFKTDGTFNVTLTVTDNKNCVNQKTKPIVVPKLPAVDFSVDAPCTGNPTTFQELYPGGSDPATSWTWNFEEGTGTGSPIQFQFSDSIGYTVTMTSKRQSGCSYSVAKNISISPGPKARFTPSVSAGVAPLNVTFNNSSKADSTFWQFDDAAHSTSKEISPAFSYGQPGTYRPLLTVKNSLNCFDTLSAEIDVVEKLLIDFAMKDFSLVNDPNSGSSKAVVTVLNSGNIPMANPEVDIDFGGGALIRQTVTGLIRPGKSLVQTLGVDIIPRSLDYICAQVAVTGDIDPYNNKQCISLSNADIVLTPYPNPATSKINFDWVGAAEEDVNVTIFKSNGEVAYQQKFNNVQPGLSQLIVSTSSLAPGLYLIQYAGSSTTKTFKIAIGN